MAATTKRRSRKRVKKNKCPTPHKIVYYNGISALRALNEILNKREPQHAECRIYRCPSGNHYHLTSKE